MGYSINVNGRLLTMERPLVMGVVNVTPDSFFADSRADGEQLLLRRCAILIRCCSLSFSIILFFLSINMDYRSFQLHYECGVMLYGAPVIGDIRRDMEWVMDRSSRVELEQWLRRPWWRKGLEKVLRVFSIWM